MRRLLALLLIAAPTQGNPIPSMRDLAVTLQGCFRPPPHLAGSQATLQFRLGPRGVLLGRPRITESASVIGEGDRRALDAAVRDALRRCTPLNLTPAFAAAVAGRPLTLRLVGGPPPQGI